MTASNTKQCFMDVIDLTVIGVLFDALPASRRDLAKGNKTLVFNDGTGLTISDNGTFWRESADEIARAIRIKGAELDETRRAIEAVMDLAGVHHA